MATLLALRTQFINISGRFDLATDPNGGDYTDDGADFFLQAGQRELDRMFGAPKGVARLWDTVAIAGYYIKFQECRAIQHVWVNNSTDRTELMKVDFIKLKNAYPELISATDQGTPLYYAPAFIRTVEDTDMNATGTFFNYVMDASDSYNSIIFLPPADEAFDVEVQGLFYTDWPDADTKTSYWMEIHPMISVWAGLYMLETSYRNTEGASDWLKAITRSVTGIDMDTVEEELSQDTVLQMEG